MPVVLMMLACAPTGITMGKKRSTCLPLWKCCKVFWCISSYSRTISRQIICALFSQPLVSFEWRCPQILTGAPSLDPAMGTCPQIANLPTSGKKCCGRPWVLVCLCRKVFRIGTVRYNWPISVHASQAFSIAHCTDSEDLPLCIIQYDRLLSRCEMFD